MSIETAPANHGQSDNDWQKTPVWEQVSQANQAASVSSPAPGEKTSTSSSNSNCDLGKEASATTGDASNNDKLSFVNIFSNPSDRALGSKSAQPAGDRAHDSKLADLGFPQPTLDFATESSKSIGTDSGSGIRQVESLHKKEEFYKEYVENLKKDPAEYLKAKYGDRQQGNSLVSPEPTIDDLTADHSKSRGNPSHKIRGPGIPGSGQTVHRLPSEIIDWKVESQRIREAVQRMPAEDLQSFTKGTEGVKEGSKKTPDMLLAMADGEPQSLAKKPFIDSEELTPADKRAIEHWHLKPETIKEIKRELNEHGKEPQDVIVDAMKKARVVGLGESHIWSANLGMITDSVAKLKAAGATHFAVELSQKEVDEILKTGKDSGLHYNKEEYVAMMLAARDAGLKVVGVDNRKANNGYGPGNEHRDEGMAEDIGGILSGDPKAKVVFVVGSNHLNSDGTKTSAAEILKDKFGKDQVVTTVASDNGRRLQDLTENLNRPVAVRTQDAPELAKLPLSPGDSQKYGQWDIVIAYPKSQSDPYYGPYEDRMPGKKK